MAESAHVNNESESHFNSVSVNSAEPEDVEDLEQLASDIFGEVKMKIMSFMGFTTMIQSDRYLVTQMMKLNLSKVLMCILPCRTSLKMAGRWNCLQPLTDTRVTTIFHLTLAQPSINQTIILHTWTIFCCLSQMISSRRFADLQQVKPRKTFKHPQLKS